jgi:transposase
MKRDGGPLKVSEKWTPRKATLPKKLICGKILSGGVSMNGKNVRRSYDNVFKREAVRLVLEDKKSRRSVEQDLGLPSGIVYKWVKQAESDSEGCFPGKGHLKPSDAEIRHLVRENELLRRERDIFKKSSGHLLTKRDDKYCFMRTHRTEYMVEDMSRALDVSKSGFYAWLRRGPSKRRQEDRVVVSGIYS